MGDNANYSDYVNQFLIYNKCFDKTFIMYENNESEDEKEDIIRVFCKRFPEYKFKSSRDNTAFFFEKKKSGG